MSDTPEQNSPSASPAFCINGPLVISTVSDWHREIAQMLATSKELELDLSHVGSADLFGIQLLCSLRQSAKSQARRIVFSSPSSAIAEVCSNAGINPDSFLTP